MSCSKTSVTLFLGLILSTAGFVLTLAGWFAPPINSYVERIRLTGPVILLIGMGLLIISCLLCVYVQGKCCSFCYSDASALKESFDSSPTSQAFQSPSAASAGINEEFNCVHLSDEKTKKRKSRTNNLDTVTYLPPDNPTASLVGLEEEPSTSAADHPLRVGPPPSYGDLQLRRSERRKIKCSSIEEDTFIL